MCIHSKTCIWHDRNIQTKKYTCAIVALVNLQFNPFLTKLSHCAKYRNFTWFPGLEILCKRTDSCPKIWENCAPPENVHTRKLGETTVFYVISFISILINVLYTGKQWKKREHLKAVLHGTIYMIRFVFVFLYSNILFYLLFIYLFTLYFKLTYTLKNITVKIK